MPSLPRISVVTPSYNQARFLEATLRSVVEQDYADLEYIVLDGGSDDGSVEIIERCADRISHWQSEKDDGQAAAIRTGLQQATGDVLAYLNSDDIYLPGALHAAGRFFTDNPDEILACGHCVIMDAQGEPYGRWYATPPTHESLIFGGSNLGFAQPAAFWRRDAYERAGGVDPSFQFTMDVDLFVRLTKERPGALLDAFTAGYRTHEDAKTSTLDDVRREELERIRQAHGYEDVERRERRRRRRDYGDRRRAFRQAGREGRWADTQLPEQGARALRLSASS